MCVRLLAKSSDSTKLLLVGASVRAAACSAIRAGLRPLAIDLFGDLDLREIAEVLTIDDYPSRIPSHARSMPLCPWMYTGGLENHPSIVAAVSRDRPLWGNPPHVLRQVRDPFRVTEVLKTEQFPTLKLRSFHAPPARDGSWLVKSRSSSGGVGIRVWDQFTADRLELTKEHYFQATVLGDSISALYVATDDGAKLIGVARQLVGCPEVAAPRFAYCGTIAPLDVVASVRVTLSRIGDVLANCLGLRGLFGCDYLLQGTQPWLVDINPRYTASVEVFEHVLNRSLLCDHAAVFHPAVFDSVIAQKFDQESSGTKMDDPMNAARSVNRFAGKIILFANHEFEAPDFRSFRNRKTRTQMPQFADLPNVGTRIRRGDPICSAFADADTMDACWRALCERASEAAAHCTLS